MQVVYLRIALDEYMHIQCVDVDAKDRKATAHDINNHSL